MKLSPEWQICLPHAAQKLRQNKSHISSFPGLLQGQAGPNTREAWGLFISDCWILPQGRLLPSQPSLGPRSRR